MNPLTVGGIVAAVLAGPPLYSLVGSGQLDSTTAIARGLLVAAACAIGTAYVQRIAAGYEQELLRQEALARRLRAAEAQAAAQTELQAQAEAFLEATGHTPPRSSPA
jgi:hypothetical protein